MRLQDLIPTDASFRLSVLNEDVFLCPATPYKVINIGKKTGKSVENMLASPTIENLSLIAMCLLSEKSFELFKPREVNLIDPITGETTSEKLGGSALMQSLVTSVDEQMDMLRAILQSIGWGEDRAKKLTDDFKNDFNTAVNNEINRALGDDEEKKSS